MELVNVDRYCEIRYGKGWDATPKKRKSAQDTVSWMCRQGLLKCQKSGRKWLIWLGTPEN